MTCTQIKYYHHLLQYFYSYSPPPPSESAILKYKLKGKCLSMNNFATQTRDIYSNAFSYTKNWDADKISGEFIVTYTILIFLCTLTYTLTYATISFRFSLHFLSHFLLLILFNFTSGCVCDIRYDGFDCSQRICPPGDDPLTLNQVNDVQLFKCIALTGMLQQHYVEWYEEQYVTIYTVYTH